MTATVYQDDLFAAQRAREEAITRVDTNADTAWMARALDIIRDIATMQDRFTTDDVWEAMHPHDEATHEPRAMGAAMRRAAKLGYVAPTPDYRPSSRPACHARPVRVWGSLIGEAS
jgi:hypothetical protein